jgi:hypothetical protein
MAKQPEKATVALEPATRDELAEWAREGRPVGKRRLKFRGPIESAYRALILPPPTMDDDYPLIVPPSRRGGRTRREPG